MEFIPKKGLNANGSEYCNNITDGLAIADQLNMSRKDIADAASVDVATVRKWSRDGYSGLKPAKRLAEHLNNLLKQSMSASVPNENPILDNFSKDYDHWLEEGKQSGFLDRWLEEAKRLGFLSK